MDLLAQRAATTPDRPAVIDARTGATRSVSAYSTDVGLVAGGLATAIDPGDRVAVLAGTSPRTAVVYWAVRRLGGTVVPLNVRLPTAALEARLDQVDPTLVVCEARTVETAVESWDGPVRSMDGPATESVDAIRPAQEEVDPAPNSLDDVATILFTSGTTGEPKGVKLTVGNLLWSAFGSAMRLGVSATDRWLCCLPMYHTGGLAPVVRTVVYGTTLVVQREFDADGTAEAIEDHDITGVSLVPTMLRRLLDVGWQLPRTLETVLLGGAPATQGLLREALEVDVPVYPTYGMTETASQIATARPSELEETPTTVGRPLLPTTVTVVDDGEPTETGDIGELVVAGPTVTPGYLDPDRTTEAMTVHGLRTGDVGRVDEEGRLFVHGRVDDLITTGGETVAPATVGEALKGHPSVAEAAVVGVSDREWGELVGAVIVPRDPNGFDLEPVKRHCRRELAGFEVPRRWAVIDALPRTPSGTVDRGAVREQLRDADDEDSVPD
ncbi:MAG: o-succinylbenzoate--CoA ligase [Halanaeroarchaeum sp.]